MFKSQTQNFEETEKVILQEEFDYYQEKEKVDIFYQRIKDKSIPIFFDEKILVDDENMPRIFLEMWEELNHHRPEIYDDDIRTLNEYVY